MSPDIASEVLEIVEEDILRIMGENPKKLSLEFLKSNIKVSNSFFQEAIKELEKKKLIHLKSNFSELTKDGKLKAKDIIEKHLIVEDYFKKTRDEREAHEAAHIIEHYVSQEAIKNIKKLSTLKEEGSSLIEFVPGRKTMISNIGFSDFRLFERIISVGIFPGQSIKITNETPDVVVIKVNNKKFALDKNIAKGIRALKSEKT